MTRRETPAPRWTHIYELKLKELVANGQTPRLISLHFEKLGFFVSAKQVRWRMWKLKIKNPNGFKHWTIEETKLLKSLAPTYSIRQLSEVLGRARPTIKTKLRQQGIRVREYRYWTDKQVKFLEGLPSNLTPKQIVYLLSEKFPPGRSYGSVVAQLKKLNHPCLRQRAKLTNREKAEIQALFQQGAGIDQIATQLSRPATTIKSFLTRTNGTIIHATQTRAEPIQPNA